MHLWRWLRHLCRPQTRLWPSNTHSSNIPGKFLTFAPTSTPVWLEGKTEVYFPMIASLRERLDLASRVPSHPSAPGVDSMAILEMLCRFFKMQRKHMVNLLKSKPNSFRASLWVCQKRRTSKSGQQALQKPEEMLLQKTKEKCAEKGP